LTLLTLSTDTPGITQYNRVKFIYVEASLHKLSIAESWLFLFVTIPPHERRASQWDKQRYCL
jgi:hypothetical protein